jgi:hypothetical protein
MTGDNNNFLSISKRKIGNVTFGNMNQEKSRVMAKEKTRMFCL